MTMENGIFAFLLFASGFGIGAVVMKSYMGRKLDEMEEMVGDLSTASWSASMRNLKLKAKISRVCNYLAPQKSGTAKKALRMLSDD